VASPRGAARGYPDIRGWAAYYRGVVSCQVFGSLDDYLRKLSYKWATWRHNNKPKRWIVGRYFGKYSKFRNDRWVFGDHDSSAHLVKFSWTAIRRHVPVKGAASPDDPALAGYWAERRKKVKPRWTATPCACSPGRTGYARYAGPPAQR
jgi:RNA-directed DNA polymerase